MTFLVDTNVISEFAKPSPEEKVVSWLHDHQHDGLYLSVVTIGEIQQGIAKLGKTRRKGELNSWLHEAIITRYSDFILPVDQAVMINWGNLSGTLMQQGSPISVMDGLIAATALTYQLTLVTRNTADFEQTGLSVVNPWL